MKKRSLTRPISGVLPVALYTNPAACGGTCIFCPSAKGIPKSYINNEDTSRAKKLGYDSALQFRAWIKAQNPHFQRSNLPYEVIVLGGSFSALSQSYRQRFLEALYEEMNTYEGSIDGTTASAKCAVLTVESRPDQITEEECRFLRKLGVSKVEIGVQHTSDSVLKAVARGHNQVEVVRATALLKLNGFKVGYHVMIGLPGASLMADIKMLSHTLWQPEYHPDYLKVYPCMLLKDKDFQPGLTKLHDEKKWQAPSDDYCKGALAELARSIPQYVRLSRIQRQFDEQDCLDGPKPGLRNRLTFHLADLRAREAGFKLPVSAIVDCQQDLKCELSQSRNDLFFEVSIANSGTLLSIARVTIMSSSIAILREIKVFGSATPIGEKGQVQGNGLGTRLLCAVEHHLLQRGYQQIKTNAAVGARTFFLKNGYQLDHEYFLAKNLSRKPNSGSGQQEPKCPSMSSLIGLHFMEEKTRIKPLTWDEDAYPNQSFQRGSR